MVRIKVDSGWPTDTTQSDDIGARRGLVSRSKGRGAWDVVEGEQIGMASWTKDVDCSGILLKDPSPTVV